MNESLSNPKETDLLAGPVEQSANISYPEVAPLAVTGGDTRDSSKSCLSIFMFVAALIWVTWVAFFRHLVTMSITADPGPSARLPGVSGAVVEIILLSIVLLPLASFWPVRHYKTIFQSWLLAALLLVFLLPAYIALPYAGQTQAVLHIVFTALYAGLLVWISRRKGAQSLSTEASADGRVGWLAAFFVASVSALPWANLGALGSILDTLLAVGYALLFGWTAAFLLEFFTFRPLLKDPYVPGDGAPSLRIYVLGSLSACVTLLVLISATTFAYSSLQVLLMIFLPAFGWYAGGVAMVQKSRRILSLTLLFGLALAAPLAFIDPDELALIVVATAGELLGYAFRATFLSLLVALAAGVGVFVLVLLRRAAVVRLSATEAAIAKPKLWSGLLLGAAALFGLLGLAGVYFGTGQPGLYGERMFVILKDQIDVSAAADMPDYQQRRQFVYKSLVEHANTTQADLRTAFDRLGLDYTPYYLVNAIEVPGNPLLRLWLLSRPEVDRILDSPRLRPLPDPLPDDPGFDYRPTAPEWNLTMIGADRVWAEFGVHGEGIIVGQSDSGVQGDHPELVGAYRGADGSGDDYNWFDPWNDSSSPVDHGGHGTHTLGSILGVRTGVAPGATWIACVNLARNLGNPALYLDCMQFNLAPFPYHGNPFSDGDPARGAHVLNNSWGCPPSEGCDPGTYSAAMHALRAAGVFVVASAGNDGPGCASLVYPPPIYDDVFSVGAINRQGGLAGFSSIGPVTSDGSNRIKPDIVAPGVNVLSSTPESTYATKSGTSMAGPHVVGVVALLWSANPALIGQIDDTEEILIKTAQPYTGVVPDCPGASDIPSTAYGFGIVDAYQAVKAALGK